MWSDCTILLRLGLTLTLLAFQVLALRIKSEHKESPKFGMKLDPEVCMTAECSQAANSILRSMDTGANPCQDFYSFTCGNFVKETVIPEDKSIVSQGSLLKDKISDQMLSSLDEISQNYKTGFYEKFLDLYESCMDLETLEQIGLSKIKSYLDEIFGQPALYNRKTVNLLSLKEILFKMHDLGFSTDILWTLYIGTDAKNSSRRILQIDQPRLGLPRKYFEKGLEDHFVKAYKSYMISAAKLFGKYSNSTEENINKLIKFETLLSNLTVPVEERRNISKLYNKVTINALIKDFSNIPWLDIINNHLSGIHTVTADEEIIIWSTEYLKGLSKIINNIDQRLVHNALPLLNADSRRVHQNFTAVLAGRTEEKPRWNNCLDYAMKRLLSEIKKVVPNIYNIRLPLAAGSIFVRNFFETSTKKEVENLASSLVDEFKCVLAVTDWLDNKTRERALEKIACMRSHVGYPSELLNDTALNEFYEEFDFDKKNYFDNTLRINVQERSRLLNKFREKVDKENWMDFKSAAIVNAFYNPYKNRIELPAGILQGHYYSLKRPNYLNYASIGNVIGHEITHGFDDKGKQYDQMGNLNSWWEPTTEEEFLKRAKGIIEQYGKYEIPEYNLTINGINTQGENIADNGGVKLSYQAYQTWVEMNEKEKLLPGLMNFTQNQLFWLSFGNSRCTKYKQETLIYLVRVDPHSPAKFRVNGPLENMPEFSKDFNCPENSPMNTILKHAVW